MKQVWQTLDGKVFGDATDAEKHEREILDRVRMFDPNGNPTTDTAQAVAICLTDLGSAEIFIDMVRYNDFDGVHSGIYPEDTGVFFWDEFSDEYRFVSDVSLAALVACAKSVLPQT